MYAEIQYVISYPHPADYVRNSEQVFAIVNRTHLKKWKQSVERTRDSEIDWLRCCQAMQPAFADAFAELISEEQRYADEDATFDFYSTTEDNERLLIWRQDIMYRHIDLVKQALPGYDETAAQVYQDTEARMQREEAARRSFIAFGESVRRELHKITLLVRVGA